MVDIWRGNKLGYCCLYNFEADIRTVFIGFTGTGLEECFQWFPPITVSAGFQEDHGGLADGIVSFDTSLEKLGEEGFVYPVCDCATSVLLVS